MRSVLALGVVLLLFAAPAFAGDGNVPQGTLSSLGLGGMQVVSDAQGMQVRGLASSFGSVTGTSLIFGQLLTPDTKNFVIGSSVNEVDANAETTAAPGALTLTKDHLVTLDLSLAVIFPDLTSYAGLISGVASGSGAVSVVQP
jgi:hypothetical protein